jgi:transposase, IS30 family
LIKLDYSPEQVSYSVKAFFGFSMSHETMYKYLLYDKKKGISIYIHLRIVPKGGESGTIPMIPGAGYQGNA